jgi:hypothetical protein
MDSKISYQTLIERLKNTSPILEQPEALTQSVIERIEQMEANRKKNKIMYIAGLLSGAAATVLLCLLIRITVHPPVSFSMESKTSPALFGQVVPSVNPEININAKDKSTAEKKEIIRAVIRKKMKTNLQKEQLFTLLQSNLNH